MGNYRKVLNIKTASEGDIVDLTGHLREAVAASRLKDGLACVFVGHSTAGLFTIENEEGLQKDMRDALQRLFPKEMDYDHHRRWGDGNGHSHIRSSFLGTSMTVPFHDGTLDLGTWQQVVLMELDNRGRDRKVIVQILGD
ncbi:secondary thiamine-phosphate synthase enzyme YjbQ [Methanomassiliicoccus luminyensis]|jgi:secondary thiamine-phosphate synthase enzyme|uniref:secondary thiamine-phosphate synthase enzyme YjbQ n=1 Tax=Methanomassiliicoccus luminyensis TaxID=1080712 RepID=UPI000362A1BC|nr:secondary thiamine-phosphate synthase enzyme YjbQ [Methanomassiliicoccus luminyensis]